MNFVRELPEGYHLAREIDAIGNKKFAICLNAVGLVLSVAVGFLAYKLRFGSAPILTFFARDSESLWQAELPVLGFVAAMLLYMALHELTHGLVYKLLTGEKLTFGLSISCAYCGVPHIYVTRKTALLSLLAPFTVFTAVFVTLIVTLPPLWAFWAVLLFASHFGGCVGDLYDTALLIFTMKGELLMNDTGPKQTFYVREQ